MKSAIPQELKEMISLTVKLLGLAIQDVYGPDLFDKIENLRLRMKSVRNSEATIVEEALEEVYLNYKNAPTEELHRVAKSFSLMLELINRNEAAYRSHRLKGLTLTESKKPHSLVFVFTSHPTEARSQNFLLLMDKVERLLMSAFQGGFDPIRDQLLHLLRMALRLNLANNRRPLVKDEAEEIFHVVLDPSILEEQIFLRSKGIDVFFRTWVGGDKDGHPKVGAPTLLQSLNLSRQKILSFIVGKLEVYKSEISLVDENLTKDLNTLIRDLRSLKTIKHYDGRRIVSMKRKLAAFHQKTIKKKFDAPVLSDIHQLIWLYPALVLPLEIREDHDLIHEALTRPRRPIAQMLTLLKKISHGLEAKWYVRGFVISMCQSSEDILAALKLTKKMTGDFVLPIVPLFENELGLTNAVSIIKNSFAEFPFKDRHLKKWGGRFEVMLGYSDSSKESGVLPGRLLVEQALLNLEEYLLYEGLTPVFFHGSGGSVSRGGGSIKEQIAWWPQTALNIYKVTVQGETVQRHFNQALIMRSQVGKIVEEFANYTPRPVSHSAVLTKFAKNIQDNYKNLVSDLRFQELVSRATPYDFLNILKIGSRPTKRSGKGQFTIRAIPWILCWTQTRLLLPIWWGIGSAWEGLAEKEKEQLKKYYADSALVQSYIKNLGFTFAKIELGVWNFHVAHSTLSKEDKVFWRNKIEEEFIKSLAFFHSISGSANMTWFRPMLGESIVFRSSMIHPLNVIQKISLERKDNFLLRETVTGIASGMLTTG